MTISVHHCTEVCDSCQDMPDRGISVSLLEFGVLQMKPVRNSHLSCLTLHVTIFVPPTTSECSRIWILNVILISGYIWARNKILGSTSFQTEFQKVQGSNCLIWWSLFFQVGFHEGKAWSCVWHGAVKLSATAEPMQRPALSCTVMLAVKG